MSRLRTQLETLFHLDGCCVLVFLIGDVALAVDEEDDEFLVDGYDSDGAKGVSFALSVCKGAMRDVVRVP